MSIYTDYSDNLIAQLTNKGRELSNRAGIEGLSFKFYGWALGRGGYDFANPVHTIPINPIHSALIDQIYPATPNLNLFVPSDLNFPIPRSVSCACRVFKDTITASYGIGEVGIWVTILNSPVNPLEVGQAHLFSITHTPLQSLTPNSQRVYRILHNF